MWNLTDFPAGIVKFGNESGTRIADFDDEGDLFLKIAKKVIKFIIIFLVLYFKLVLKMNFFITEKSIRNSINMPIGVQIVARPYKEELVLRAMVELDEAPKIIKNT